MTCPGHCWSLSFPSIPLPCFPGGAERVGCASARGAVRNPRHTKAGGTTSSCNPGNCVSAFECNYTSNVINTPKDSLCGDHTKQVFEITLIKY